MFKKKTQITGFVDIHNHILPGIDDGAKNMQEAVEMIRIAYEEGIRSILVTPHYNVNRPYSTKKEIQEAFLIVKEHIEKSYEDLSLYVGNEVFYSTQIDECYEKEDILLLAGTRYTLVEFMPSDSFDHIRTGLNSIIMLGYTPVLAHFERYYSLVDNISRVEELRSMGVIIQANAQSILGEYGTTIKKQLKGYLKKNLIDIVATDAHSPRSRAPRLREVSDLIARKYGQDYMQTVLIDNPQKIVSGEYI